MSDFFKMTAKESRTSNAKEVVGKKIFKQINSTLQTPGFTFRLMEPIP